MYKCWCCTSEEYNRDWAKVIEQSILHDKLPIISAFHQAIGLMSRVFANGLGDWGSIPR